MSAFGVSIQDDNPGLILNGQESGAAWSEFREVSGALWLVQNAMWNGTSGFAQVSSANSSYAFTRSAAGVWSLLSAPPGAGSPIAWTTITSVSATGVLTATSVTASTLTVSAGLTVPVGSITTAFLANSAVTSTKLSPGAIVDLSGLAIYNVAIYKQSGDPDDTLSFSRAAAVLNANPRGGILYVPPGVYGVTALPTFTAPYCRVVGAGLWATQINVTAANTNGFSWTGTSGATVKYGSLEALFLNCSAVSSSTSNKGLTLSWAAEFRCREVQISDFFTGVAIGTSPNVYFLDVETSYSGTGSGVGFSLDGTAGGNVSAVFRDCYFVGSSASQTTTGWNVFSSAAGGDCGDLNFLHCESALAGTGMKFDFANTNFASSTDCSSDIIIRDCAHDEFFAYGVQAINGNVSSLLKVEGGYFNGNINSGNGAGTVVGIYAAAPVVIQGAEFIPFQTNQASPPVAWTGSAFAIQLAAGADGSQVVGCSINGWTRGVYVNGANSVGVSGNRLNSSPTGSGNTFGVSGMTSVSAFNSSNLAISGNSLTAGGPNQNSGLYFDATCTNASAIGNVFSPNVASPKITNNGASTVMTSNVGYNPLGALLANPTLPAAPASWTYTNQTGVGLGVYVSGGTVSRIRIDGRDTGLTAGMFRLPPNKSMDFAYTAIPAVNIIGD